MLNCFGFCWDQVGPAKVPNASECSHSTGVLAMATVANKLGMI